ncbi:MAG: VTC domain-containing protein, partial [Myxococcota bacterium]
FVEVKTRNNEVICKTRGQLPKESWSDLVQRPSAQSMMSVPGKSRRAVERFVSLTHSLNATPRVLVRYEREPYMSVIDDYARVTFDRKVLSKRASKWELELPQETWRPVDNPLNTKTTNESLTILELKFTSAVPLWMTNLVRRLQLQRLSFSKYATSVVAWHSGAGGYTWDKRTVAGW